MITVIDKSTHVFIKDENSFTSIAKKTIKGVHQIYTDKKLTSAHADAIEKAFGNELEVSRINFEKGFLFIRTKKNADYRSIVTAIKTIL